MLRAPQLTMRAGSAALASCSSSSASSSAMPALPPRGSGAKQRRRSPFSSSTQTLIARAGNATEEASKAADTGMDDCVDNIGDFCSLDKSGKKLPSKRTLGDKEQDFIEAMKSFYYDGTPSMSNEEFENLKEELVWAGSKVAVLSGDELRFLEASLAYNAGKPVMPDADFDALKQRLKRDGSFVTAQGPRCSLRSGKMYADAAPDYLLMTALNLPAAAVTLAALFSVDDLSGFEITKLIELPEPWGIVIVWGVVLPLLYVFASSLTGLVLRDAVILKAPCPQCGEPARSYFGDLLGVAGSRDRNGVECGSCGAKLEFDNAQRSVTVLEEGKKGGDGSSGAKPKAA